MAPQTRPHFKLERESWRRARRLQDRLLLRNLEHGDVLYVDLAPAHSEPESNITLNDVVVRVFTAASQESLRRLEALIENPCRSTGRIPLEIHLTASGHWPQPLQLSWSHRERTLARRRYLTRRRQGIWRGPAMPSPGENIKLEENSRHVRGTVVGVMGYAIEPQEQLRGPFFCIELDGALDQPERQRHCANWCISDNGDHVLGLVWRWLSARQALVLTTPAAHRLLKLRTGEIDRPPPRPGKTHTTASTQVVAQQSAIATSPLRGKPTPAYPLENSGMAMLILCFAMLGFALQPDFGSDAPDGSSRVAFLRQNLASLQAAARVDAQRSVRIRKVKSIIERYNPSMPEAQQDEIAEAIQDMASKYSNLNVDLICAAITHESARTWHPRVVSPKGAIGLMQLMPTTGRRMARAEGIAWRSPQETLTDPVVNIRLGCRYLSRLIARHGLQAGLAAYNGGEQRAVLWRQSNYAEGILHAETAVYVPRILKYYRTFSSLAPRTQAATL